MEKPAERILLIESDPEISDIVARQTLQPMGYLVKIVGDSGMAIKQVVQWNPDLVIMNLRLPGLSGKDLLVAFSSQGIDVPVVVLAEKGQESDVIQAFRLGAFDYIPIPIREAEVVSAVERVLNRVRERKEKERLSEQLNATNRELQQRVRELTTIFSLGKAVTSITNQQILFDRILEGAIYISQADRGWVLTRKDDTKVFYLSAFHNLPTNLQNKLNQPWSDGVSSLVALSGESLRIHGAPLKRLKIARLAKSAIVVPIKVQREVIGLLVVTRDKAVPFTQGNQTMLEAVADYAAISIVNARLFDALEAKAKNLQEAARIAKENEKVKTQFMFCVSHELKSQLISTNDYLDALHKQIENGDNRWIETLRKIRETLQWSIGLLKRLEEFRSITEVEHPVTIDLVNILQQVIAEKADDAAQKKLNIFPKLPSSSSLVEVDPGKIKKVAEILLSSAIAICSDGSLIVELHAGNDGKWQVAVRCANTTVEQGELDDILKLDYLMKNRQDFAHLQYGLDLIFADAILKTFNSRLVIESDSINGTSFIFPIGVQNKKY